MVRIRHWRVGGHRTKMVDDAEAASGPVRGLPVRLALQELDEECTG